MSATKTLAGFNIAQALSQFLGRPLEENDADAIAAIGMQCASFHAGLNSETWRIYVVKHGLADPEITEKVRQMPPVEMSEPWKSYFQAAAA